MYINPIIVGVIGTLVAEFVLIIVAAAVIGSKKGNKNGEDESSGAPCDIDHMCYK